MKKLLSLLLLLISFASQAWEINEPRRDATYVAGGGGPLSVANPGFAGALGYQPFSIGSALVDFWDGQDLSTMTFGNSGTTVATWKGRKAGIVVSQATSGNQPGISTTNGINSLTFATGKWLRHTGSLPVLSQPYTFVLVGKATATGVLRTAMLTGNANLYYSTGNVPTIYAGTGAGSGTLGAVAERAIHIATFNGTSSKVYINNYNATVSTTPGTLATSANITIGAADGAGTNSFSGTIECAMLINGTPTTAQIQDLLRYCAGRYTKARYIFKGDSITRGSNASNILTNAFVPLTISALSLTNTVNLGYSSETLQTALAAFDYDMRPRLTTELGSQTVVVYEGTNDLAIAGRTGTQLYNDLVSYCTLLKQAGVSKVIVCTMISRNFASTQEGYRTTFNTNIRNAVSPPWDAIADFAADSRIGTQTASTNTTYFNADAIHPNDTGHGILKDILVAVFSFNWWQMLLMMLIMAENARRGRAYSILTWPSWSTRN